MMDESTLMYGLYIIYYLLLPAGIIIPLWMILKKKAYLKSSVSYDESQVKRNRKTIKEKRADLKRLQVFLLVFFLIFIPAVNLSFFGLHHTTINRHRIYQGTFHSKVEDPVKRQIGPTGDIESVIEEMEEAPEYQSWYVEDIQEEIDLQKLDRLPGRLTVYYLVKQDVNFDQIVIAYSYFSPLPVTQVYGFEVYEYGDKKQAFLEEKDTIVYPLNPAEIDPF